MAVEKIWKMREGADADNVRQLSSELGVDPVLAELLVQRDVRTFEQARSFFRPNLDDLHDPFLMTDMDKAVERVRKAVVSGEKILIYGDYDVDGTTAVSLVYSFLRRLTRQIDFYIPERLLYPLLRVHWIYLYRLDLYTPTLFHLLYVLS